MSYDPKTAWSLLQRAAMPPEAFKALSPLARQEVEQDTVYLNHMYQVNVRTMENAGPNGADLTMLSIKLRSKEVVKDWRHFQLIKNQLCGKESLAIEVFPPESKLVDTANQYFLWVFPDDTLFPFIFQTRLISEGNGNPTAWGSGSKQRPFENRPEDCLESADLDAMIAQI